MVKKGERQKLNDGFPGAKLLLFCFKDFDEDM
jgi:hypothetical protein